MVKMGISKGREHQSKIMYDGYESKIKELEGTIEKMFNEEDMKQFAWECVTNFVSNSENRVEMKLVEVIIDRNNEQFKQFQKEIKI
jgi:hypothetical protein